MQACVDSSSKADAAKVHSVLLPVATKGANDPAPDVREANMGVLVSFALKAGNNMALLDKVRFPARSTRDLSDHIVCELQGNEHLIFKRIVYI